MFLLQTLLSPSITRPMLPLHCSSFAIAKVQSPMLLRPALSQQIHPNQRNRRLRHRRFHQHHLHQHNHYQGFGDASAPHVHIGADAVPGNGITLHCNCWGRNRLEDKMVVTAVTVERFSEIYYIVTLLFCTSSMLTHCCMKCFG